MNDDIKAARPDLKYIVDLIGDHTKVLDIGCGDGSLLSLISTSKTGAKAVGIELSQEGVNECVKRGFSVIQGDADRDLEGYIANVFDFIILSHSIQSVKRPGIVLRRAAEIGRHVIVSFYNFAYWRNRVAGLLTGRVPGHIGKFDADFQTSYRMCSILDFIDLCDSLGLRIEKKIVLDLHGKPLKMHLGETLFGYQAIFLLTKA